MSHNIATEIMTVLWFTAVALMLAQTLLFSIHGVIHATYDIVTGFLIATVVANTVVYFRD